MIVLIKSMKFTSCNDDINHVIIRKMSLLRCSINSYLIEHWYMLAGLKFNTMKKILVPTDYSDCANNAIDVAKEIANKSGAELYLLHLEEVVPEVAHVAHHAAMEDNQHHIIGHARFQLQQLVDIAVKEGCKAKSVFVPNEGKEAIEDYIKPYEIDFMVMGSHGARGIREAFIGSKTQKVIKNSTVPVLVIKKQVTNFSPKKILFASTFREDATQSLKQVADFAKLWNADLNLVFLNLLSHLIEPNEAKRIMSKQMEFDPGVPYTLNINDTNDEEWGISKFARLLNADVIAVVYDKHTGFNRLFSSSVAEKLINHEEIPVLVMAHQ
jgi:nucleotide-binding universal stress UspA family protein